MKKRKKRKSHAPYGDIEEFTGAQETSGAIFEADVDLTHPLLYGYTNQQNPDLQIEQPLYGKIERVLQ